jgi:DNA-binding NarL/FixJ family response regulator
MLYLQTQARPMLIVALNTDQDRVPTCRLAGVHGHLGPDATGRQISEFVRALCDASDRITQGRPAPRRRDVATDLTRRERDVFGLLTAGCTNKEIAAELWLAESTVKNHVASIYRKTGAHRRAQLLATLPAAAVGLNSLGLP